MSEDPAPGPRLGAVADLAELVRRAAQAQPEATAITQVGGREITWAALDDEVGAVARGLLGLGIVAPARVLLCLHNHIELVTCYLGTLRAQAVAVPVNPHASVADLTRMIADSGARVVIADGHTAAAVRPAAADQSTPPRVVVVDEPAAAHETTYDALIGRTGSPYQPARPDVPPLPDPEKLAALLYTAGSSGVPRAAMLTHRALLANIDQVGRVVPPLMTGEDVVVGALPLFHVYALNAILGGVLASGARLVLMGRFEPQATLDVIADQGCTVIPVAPPAIAHWMALEGRAPGLLRGRLASARLVLSGSSTLAADLVSGFAQASGHRVHQGYGLTEAAPVVTSTLCAGDADSHGADGPAGDPASLGAPIPGVEIRVVDEGGPAEPGDPGELQIRGDNLFSGYWPDGADGPAADGWWATGDIGLIAADGSLSLVDRADDTIVIAGFTVYPREVESTIRELPGVQAAAVLAGPGTDGAGTVVVAYVVAPELPDAADAVRRHCAARLAGFKQPARIEVADTLPTTLTGAFEKGRLRQLERRRALGLVE